MKAKFVELPEQKFTNDIILLSENEKENKVIENLVNSLKKHKLPIEAYVGNTRDFYSVEILF